MVTVRSRTIVPAEHTPAVHFRRLLLQTGFRLTQQASSIPPQGGPGCTHVPFLQQSSFSPPHEDSQGGWFFPPQSARRGTGVDFAVAIGVWVDASVAFGA